jgi:hypothetical protein|tara:strand:+ start:11497 stop:11682 length:186 start_codon:yes stop_codon:yes gene_type:complete
LHVKGRNTLVVLVEEQGESMSRPEWERMSDDGMNKFLKVCVTALFLYGAYEVAIALIGKFS